MFIKSFFSSLRVRHHPQICQPENQLQKLHLREKQRHRQGRSHDRLTSLQHQHRRKKISAQWARAFYKNRIPFSVADDPEFRRAMEMMRPGVGDQLLNKNKFDTNKDASNKC